MHTGKLTRGSLLRGLGAGALALAAIPALGDLTGGTAFAQPSVTGVRTSSSSPGGLIVKAALGSSIAKINAKYRTTTVFTFTGTDQALLGRPVAARLECRGPAPDVNGRSDRHGQPWRSRLSAHRRGQFVRPRQSVPEQLDRRSVGAARCTRSQGDRSRRDTLA